MCVSASVCLSVSEGRACPFGLWSRGPRDPHLSHDGGREGAVVIDPAIGAGLCGPRAVGLCAVGKRRSLLGDGEEEAGLGLPLPVPGQPGLQLSILAEVGIGRRAAVVPGDGSGEVL